MHGSRCFQRRVRVGLPAFMEIIMEWMINLKPEDTVFPVHHGEDHGSL